MESEFQPISSKSFYGTRYGNLKDAISKLETTQGEAEIIILPPDADELTDEDEVEEDCLEDSNLPNDVPGQVELHFDDESLASDDSEDNLPLSSFLPKKKTDNKNYQPAWKQQYTDISMNDITHGCEERLVRLKEDLNNKTPVEIFERLFDDKILEIITEQSILYARQKNNQSFFVNKEELKVFIGVLLFSGYHRLPRERMYWSLDEDVSVPIINNSISRNRFHEIKKHLHFADNSKIDKEDKMYKLRPLVDILNQNFQQWEIFHENLSIDEAMIKYFGHHPSKQFIKGKPVRFGFKDGMLCRSTGYCYNFETYAGAKKNQDTASTAKLPLGSKVVLGLLECVTTPTDHTIYFDNYFSSHDLLTTLRQKGFRATGTIRDNRTKKCPFIETKLWNKKDRGYFQEMYDFIGKMEGQ